MVHTQINEVKDKRQMYISKEFTMGKDYLSESNILDEVIADIKKEHSKLDNAAERARIQLRDIRNHAIEIGTNEEAFFDAQLRILEEPGYIDAIKAEIYNKKVDAAKAAYNITAQLIKASCNSDDEVKNERVADIKDVSDRLLQNLHNEDAGILNCDPITEDGKRVYVTGNIKRSTDIHQVISNGGDGVGLFRTEFLYKNRDGEPSEDEQYECYKYVLERCGKKPVVIRTLCGGGDIALPYSQLQIKSNPLLGYRGRKFHISPKTLFKTQIRALLRASIHGNLHVALPMISGVEEYETAMKLVKECKDELFGERFQYSKHIKWGIIIEMPAAALCAEELAQFADFLSISIKDLIKYTLGIDWIRDENSYPNNLMHPAVLKLIKMSIDGAHKYDKWIGMCGEIAEDSEVIPILASLGLDELSMSASSIPLAKKLLLYR